MCINTVQRIEKKGDKTLEVWANPDGGFYVVEAGCQDSVGNQYNIPRGWIYPTIEEAMMAIPFVRAGICYPTGEQLHDEIVDGVFGRDNVEVERIDR